MPLQIPVTQTGLEASIEAAAKKAGRNLQINLGTNAKSINSLSQPLGRITGQADEFTKSMEAANARVFAFGASVGIINGVTKAFSSLVKNTIEVEKSLVEINTVLNASGDSLQKFGNKLFDVARNTGQTFDVVAKGALELARQGLSTEETLKRINDALILSRLSGLDAQQSVEGLTAAFNSFKETGITTSEILNKLVVVSQKYSVSERDLIEGLKRSASVADQAGVSFDELVGIITTVQERTARGGAVIGNAFKTIFARIQDTGALQDLTNLGIQVTDLEGKVLPATRILQNLAGEFNNLSQLEQADIAKKLGGVYQLSNLLAAVKDLSSEQSKYNDIVQLSAGATNEAYQKNAALNETLASLINKVSVSAQQLGATLGKIGITDSLKSLLGFFNNILEGIQNILGEESALGTFVKGLAKGIGNVLAGPGLALFGAIIAKLSKDLISFGLESLKSFFKIGQATKEINALQGSIASTLLRNKDIQAQILALEGNRVAQAKFFTTALNEQYLTMQKMQGIAASIAPAVYGGTRGGRGGASRNAAGGYMPAVSQESRDISRGVGGARGGDRPVIIPNFAFGGGKKGTMVAHTGEYIVPNFAAGGSAIFNRDMVRSMGLPAGAQKISAAGGFIPNFASFDQRVYEGYYERFKAAGTKPKDLETYASGRGRNKSPEYIQAAKDRLRGKSLLPQSSVLNIDADKLGGLGVVSVSGGQEASATTSESRSQMSPSEVSFLDKFFGKGNIQKVVMSNIQSKSLGTIDQKLKADNQKAFRNIVKEKFTSPLVDTGAKLIGKIFKGNDQADLVSKLSSKTSDPALFSESVLGGIFESAIRVATKSVEQIGAFDDVDTKAAFDFEESGGASGEFIKAFGFTRALYKADAKKTANSKTIQSIIGKSLRDREVGDRIKNNYLAQAASQLNKKDLVKAASGYVPNFADPLKEAIGREISAGVPASQIYIDKNSSLKNSMNPMGLMVANRRDEPAGGMQGINRARREGANPMMYGAANGFVPNFQRRVGTGSQPPDSLGGGGGGGDSADIEKPKRDLLGVIFAVQTGLSLLTGATADATGGFGKLTNGIASVASAFSTVLLVSQGLSSTTGKLGPLLGRLGPYAAGAVAAFEAFKVGVQLYRDWTGKTAEAAKSTARFNDAVQAAGISLDNLSQSEALKNTRCAEGALYNLGAGFGLSGREYKDPELQKMYAQTALLTGMSEKEIAQKAEQAGALKITGYQRLATGGTRAVGEDFDPDKFKQVLADLATMPQKILEDGTINPEYEKRIERIKKLKQEQAKIEKDINKPLTENSLVEQINLNLVKSRLKSELDLSISKQRTLDGLDKQRISSEILNNLSEEQLDNLNYEIERRDKIRESADSVASLIDQQIQKLDGVVGKEKESEAIRQRIKNLTQEDLLNQNTVLSLADELQAIISDNPELRKAEREQLQQILQDLELKRQSELDSLKTNKEITGEVKNQRDALMNLISASSRRASTAAFQASYANTGQINANQLQIGRLQSQLSRPGITDAQTRAIENQIAALETNTARLNAENDLVQNLTSAREKALSSLPENLQLDAELADQINQTSDYTKIISILKNKNEEILKSSGKYDENISKAADEIQQSGLTAKQTADSNIALAEQQQKLTNVFSDIITAAQKASLAFEQIPQQIEDLDFEAMTTTSGRRLAEIAYERQTRQMQMGAGVEQSAAIERQRSVKGVGQLFKEEFSTTVEERAMNLNKSIVEASLQFKDNLIDGVSKAIEEGGSLGDVLRSAALDFARAMTRAGLQNVAGQIGGFFGFAKGGLVPNMASGGMINGGSGSRDDVPAMLMGGEYVLKKTAVQKYGSNFLDALNNGRLGGYAKGGKVDELPNQTGAGGFFVPGLNGYGSIVGKENLLGFATQSYTSGLGDVVRSGDNFASVNLEAESYRLTRFGRTNDRMFQATQSAKEEAFGLYGQQIQQEIDYQKQLEEYKKQKKAERKALRNQLIMMAVTAAAGPILGAAGAGFKAAFGAAGGMQNFLPSVGAGLKGIFTGGMVDGVNVGGLGSLFKGVGQGLTGNFSAAGNSFKLSQIGNSQQLQAAFNKSAAAGDGFAGFLQNNLGYTPKEGGVAVNGGGAGGGIFGWLNNIRSGLFGKKEDIDANGFLATGEDIKDPSQWIRGGPSTAFGEGLLPPLDWKDQNSLPFLTDEDLSLQFRDNQFLSRATGGVIPPTTGIDTIPAMLSGGEFIMNRAASQNIGAGNLQALNAGASSLPTEEKTEELNDRLIAKLDELIEATSGGGDITINVEAGTGKTSEEGGNSENERRVQMARLIKDMVLKVIQDEKRLGGTLRRG